MARALSRNSSRLLILTAVVLLAIVTALRERSVPTRDEPSESPRPAATPALREVVTDSPTAEAVPGEIAKASHDPPESASRGERVLVRQVTVRDRQRRIVFQGDIDLSDTLARIDAGQRLPYPNDGSVFQNREGRLPARRSGYYREWVHATPGVSGPGPQRVVTGEQREAYYTADHYLTFQRVR